MASGPFPRAMLTTRVWVCLLQIIKRIPAIHVSRKTKWFWSFILERKRIAFETNKRTHCVFGALFCFVSKAKRSFFCSRPLISGISAVAAVCLLFAPKTVRSSYRSESKSKSKTTASSIYRRNQNEKMTSCWCGSKIHRMHGPFGRDRIAHIVRINAVDVFHVKLFGALLLLYSVESKRFDANNKHKSEGRRRRRQKNTARKQNEYCRRHVISSWTSTFNKI